MEDVPISLAHWNYDRTAAIVDGRIQVKGCKVNSIILPPHELFPRAFAHAEFDVCELSLSRQAQRVADGTNQYAAIPVFPSRSFRHASLYVRADRGIDHPTHLIGKSIGLRNYDDTAAVVVRGLLRDEYEVGISDIRWVIGDFERPERELIDRPRVPDHIQIDTLPYGSTLDKHLESGQIDCLIGLVPPACFRLRHPAVRRLFPDWRTAEQSYFAKTKLFPIMHVLGIRRSLLLHYPWMAQSVYRAFSEAKAIAMGELGMLQAPKCSLPWTVAEFDATKQLMGDDYWPYGLQSNREILETTLRHLFEDGLLARELSVSELFSESSALMGCQA